MLVRETKEHACLIKQKNPPACWRKEEHAKEHPYQKTKERACLNETKGTCI